MYAPQALWSEEIWDPQWLWRHEVHAALPAPVMPVLPWQVGTLELELLLLEPLLHAMTRAIAMDAMVEKTMVFLMKSS